MHSVETIRAARRIVVKTGSSLVADAASGEPFTEWMASLAGDIARLRRQGREVLLVSSGAVALGRSVLGLAPGPLKLEEKQAAASCGQIALMQAWREAFAAQSVPVAQLLLTLEDSESRRRYLNARATLETLLERAALPVINENDTVATAEIRVGDNDRLAARVAQMSGADLLVLLSDVDGLYTADPARDPSAQHIPVVGEIDDAIRAMASPSRTATGTGGMVTKLLAAEIATRAGCHTVLTLGSVENPLQRLEERNRNTFFPAHTTPRNARKEWIAGSLSAMGAFIVDTGAAAALQEGKSLLPAGVSEVRGEFQRGDAVLIVSSAGSRLGKGLSAYSAEDARRIVGKRSSEIEAVLGYKGRDALVHRDDMVLL